MVLVKVTPEQLSSKELAVAEVHFRKITIHQLKLLGYDLGKRQTPVGNKPYKYGIIELMNDDKKGNVSFCYLYSTIDKNGIILPKPFDYYLSHRPG